MAKRENGPSNDIDGIEGKFITTKQDLKFSILGDDNDSNNGIENGTGTSEGAGSKTIDGTRSPEIDAGEPKKKRGRPKLTDAERAERAQGKTKASLGVKPPSKDEVKNVAGLYQFVNNAFFSAKKKPQYQISLVEAEKIADPLTECLSEWGISLTGTNNPYLKLVAAIIGVYGVRVYADFVAKRSPRENVSPQSDDNSNVTQFKIPT